MILRWAAIAVPLAALTPALAFDDKQFCVAVRQLALDDNWRPPIDLPAGNLRAVCMVPQPNNPTA